VALRVVSRADCHVLTLAGTWRIETPR
jgi:hypothetical protein